MKGLMSATEKRNQVDSARDAESQAELTTIIGLINNASGDYIQLNFTPNKNVEAILKGEGYRCGFVQTGMNESAYQVSW